MANEPTAQPMLEPVKLQLPPNDQEAEECLIGCLFYDPSLLETTQKHMVEPSDFFWSKVGVVFRAVRQVAKANNGLFDARLVAEKLTEMGEGDIGGVDYINKLTSKVVSTIMFPLYLYRIKSAAMRRAMIVSAHKTINLAYDNDLALCELEDAYHAQVMEITNPFPKIANIVSFAEVAQADYERTLRIADGDEIAGYDLPQPDLNDALNEKERGDLIIIGGPTSSGKSSLMWEWALHDAEKGRKVLYISLEMPNNQMSRRGLKQQTGTGNKELRASNPDIAAHLDAYRHWVETKATKLTGLFLCRMVSPKLKDLLAVIENAIEDEGVEIVYVDYLQLVQANDQTNKTLGQEEISNTLLNGVALRFNIVVVTGSQFSRNYSSQKPTLNDLRWGGIEQAATKIILLHPSVDTSDTNVMSEWEERFIPTLFVLGKNRNEMAGQEVAMLWDRVRIKFVCPAKEHQLQQQPPQSKPARQYQTAPEPVEDYVYRGGAR